MTDPNVTNNMENYADNMKKSVYHLRALIRDMSVDERMSEEQRQFFKECLDDNQ